MSANERLNNIILERTIEYNTTQPQNSTADRGTRKERPKSTWPTHVLSMFVTSYHMSQLRYQFTSRAIVNHYAVT